MKQELQIQYFKVVLTSFWTTIWIKEQRCYLLLLWQKRFLTWFSNYTEIKKKILYDCHCSRTKELCEVSGHVATAPFIIKIRIKNFKNQRTSSANYVIISFI